MAVDEKAERAARRRFSGKVVRRLKADYPDAECALNFDTPLQLMVATMLSAQCTDVRVNIVTRNLFKKYPTAAHFARVRLSTLEKAIQSTGFFRNKAKNIKAACQTLVEQHNGQVPRTMESLVVLPGIGRKTANVVLGTAYGLAAGVVVDTHVSRISRRLRLTGEQDPEKIEQNLMASLPKSEWISFSHRMIHHGRKTCAARKPLCEQCSLTKICPKVGVVP